MKTLLWLDDLRDPRKEKLHRLSPVPKPYRVVWVRSFEEFTAFVEKNGIPGAVSFDYDLGVDRSLGIALNNPLIRNGAECALWLKNYCLEKGAPFPPYAIHSINESGKEEIFKVLADATS